MGVQTDRKKLIAEGDAEAVRKQEKELRKKVSEALTASELLEQAIENYIREYGNKPKQKQTTDQIQVTDNPNDSDPHHLKNKITVTNSESNPLKATIPSGIVKFLDIKPNSTLEWKPKVINGDRVAIVKPTRKQKN